MKKSQHFRPGFFCFLVEQMPQLSTIRLSDYIVIDNKI